MLKLGAYPELFVRSLDNKKGRKCGPFNKLKQVFLAGELFFNEVHTILTKEHLFTNKRSR